MNDEYNAIVDDNNKVEFKNVRAGKYTILVDDNNYEKYTKQLIISKNTPNPYEDNITINLKYSILKLSIYPPETKGEMVTLGKLDEETGEFINTSKLIDDNNQVIFDQLSEGYYNLEINIEGYETYYEEFGIDVIPRIDEININLNKISDTNVKEIISNIDYTDIWYPILTSTVTDTDDNPVTNQNITLMIGESVPSTLTTDENGQITTKITNKEPTTITINADNITKTINFTPKTRTIEYTYLVNSGDGRTCAYFIDTNNQNSYVGYNNNSDPAFLMNTTTNQKISASDLRYTLPYNEKTPVTITYNAKEITFKYRGRTSNNENTLTLTLTDQDMSNYRLAFKAVRTVKLYNFKVDGVISTEAQNSNNWSGNISVTTDNNDTYIAISGNTNCILNTLH